MRTCAFVTVIACFLLIPFCFQTSCTLSEHDMSTNKAPLVEGNLNLGCPESTGGHHNPGINPCENQQLTESVFGPKTYMRNEGKPVSVDDTFSVPFPGKYCISIYNGPPPNDARVSSAVISVDGSALFRPNDFNQNVSYISEYLYLEEGDHSLSVELRSSSHSSIELLIRGLPEATEEVTHMFPELEIATFYHQSFKYTDREVFCYKLIDPNTAQSGEFCLDDQNNCIDYDNVFRQEKEARFQEIGLMDDRLAGWVFGNSPDIQKVELVINFDSGFSSRPMHPVDDTYVLAYRQRKLEAIKNFNRMYKDGIEDQLEDDGVEVLSSSEYSHIIVTMMTREDVLRYYKDTTRFYELTMDEANVDLLSIDSSKSMEFGTFYHDNYQGRDVNIAIVEPGEVYFDNPFIISDPDVRIDKHHPQEDVWFTSPVSAVRVNPLRSERHATFAAGCAGSASLIWLAGAPMAKIISANWERDHIYYDASIKAIDWAVADRHADILSQSYGGESFEDAGTAEAYHMDKLINDVGVIAVAAAGNDEDELVNCEEYNTICVGAYLHQGTVDTPGHTVDDMWTYSSYKDPNWSGDRQHPHIVASGSWINSTREDDQNPKDYICTLGEIVSEVPSFCERTDPDDINNCITNQQPEYCSGGTSFSTPLVAGLIALMMEYDQYAIQYNLKIWPELIHSILFASATNDVDCHMYGYPVGTPCQNSNVRERSDYDGAGGVNGNDVFNLMRDGVTEVVEISRTPNGSYPVIWGYHIPEGHTMRAVVTWLEDVKYVKNNGKLRNDFDLMLFDSNYNLLKGSGTELDNHEIIEYEVNVGGVYYLGLKSFEWAGTLDSQNVALAVYWFPTDPNNR